MTTTTTYPNGFEQEDLSRRAIAAWYRSRGVGNPMSPRLELHQGRLYVVLEGAAGTLAVYRVKNDGALKRLKRWAADIADPVVRWW